MPGQRNCPAPRSRPFCSWKAKFPRSKTIAQLGRVIFSPAAHGQENSAVRRDENPSQLPLSKEIAQPDRAVPSPTATRQRNSTASQSKLFARLPQGYFYFALAQPRSTRSATELFLFCFSSATQHAASEDGCAISLPASELGNCSTGRKLKQNRNSPMAGCVLRGWAKAKLK